jgi:choline dehydrogenase-like flavoprotein
MLILGATVTEVVPDTFGGSIRSIKFTGASRKKYTAFVKAVVLCAGGIENPRIMLCSNSHTENGLGNQNGLVGRYFMDHLRGPVGHFKLSDSRKLQKVFGRYVIGKNLFRIGLRLNPQRQKDDGLLNAAAWLGETVSANDPWNALRRVAKTRRVKISDAKIIGSNLGILGAGVFDFINSGAEMPRVYESLTLDCMTEQVPNYNSRISLSHRTDHFGIKLPKVDWRVDPLEFKTVKALTASIALETKKLGLPDIEVADWIYEEQDFSSEFVDVAHPMGTTRMSDSEKLGVVDANCESHFTKGLFLAGSSVFPTGSHCNPTLMIVALAIRIADKLKERYKQQQH